MNIRIRKTKAFKKLSKIQLKLYGTTKHLAEIERSYRITKREGITVLQLPEGRDFNHKINIKR